MRRKDGADINVTVRGVSPMAFSVRTGITVFCEWFTERFDTRDLKDAKALLEQLG